MATTTEKHGTTLETPEQEGQWTLYIVTHEHRYGTDTSLLMRHEEPGTLPLSDVDLQAHNPRTYELHREDEVVFIEYAPPALNRIVSAAIQTGAEEANALLAEIDSAPPPVAQTFSAMRAKGHVSTVANGKAIGPHGEQIDLAGGEIVEIEEDAYLFRPDGDDQDFMVLDGECISGLTLADDTTAQADAARTAHA